MLFKLIRCEKMKLKRSPVYLSFLLLPLIPAVLGTLNYLNNAEILSGWYDLWTQHTLFTCYFFLPIAISIYCSYIIYEEENCHNWNKVLSLPTRRSLIFAAKLVMVSFMVLASQAWIMALFVISGKLIGITEPLPWDRLITWTLCGALGGMVTAAIQLFLSLLLKSFALPIGVGFIGGMSGLLFLAKDLGHIWPYSLMAYGMNSNAPQQLLSGGYAQFIVICIVYITLFCLASAAALESRDV